MVRSSMPVSSGSRPIGIVVDVVSISSRQGCALAVSEPKLTLIVLPVSARSKLAAGGTGRTRGAEPRGRASAR
jgi:hypothetical protein